MPNDLPKLQTANWHGHGRILHPAGQFTQRNKGAKRRQKEIAAKKRKERKKGLSGEGCNYVGSNLKKIFLEKVAKETKSEDGKINRELTQIDDFSRVNLRFPKRDR